MEGSARARAKITVDEIVNGKKERRWMRRHKGESITIAIIVVTAFLAIIEGSCCVSVSAGETTP